MTDFISTIGLSSSASSSDLLVDWVAARDGDPRLLTGTNKATFVGETAWIAAANYDYVRLTPDDYSKNGWMYFDLGENLTEIQAQIAFSANTSATGDSSQGDGFGFAVLTGDIPSAGQRVSDAAIGGLSFFVDHYNGGQPPPDNLKVYYNDNIIQIINVGFNLLTNPTSEDELRYFDCSIMGPGVFTTLNSDGTDQSAGAHLLTKSQPVSGRYIAINAFTGGARAEHRIHGVRVRKIERIN